VRGRFGVLHGKRENVEMRLFFLAAMDISSFIFLMQCSEHPQSVLRCEARSHQSRRVESALHRKKRINRLFDLDSRQLNMKRYFMRAARRLSKIYVVIVNHEHCWACRKHRIAINSERAESALHRKTKY